MLRGGGRGLVGCRGPSRGGRRRLVWRRFLGDEGVERVGWCFLGGAGVVGERRDGGGRGR